MIRNNLGKIYLSYIVLVDRGINKSCDGCWSVCLPSLSLCVDIAMSIVVVLVDRGINKACDGCWSVCLLSLSLCRHSNVYCGGVGWQRDKQGL